MRKLLEANVVDCLEYRILVLVGEIDLSVGEWLLAKIVGLLRGGDVPLLIDMTGVRFCDSTGLNVAVDAKRHADACGCTLMFFGLSERVEKLFQITAIDRLIQTYPTLGEAAAAVTNPITATQGSPGDGSKPTPHGND
jgi:anti-sigma B factor antagonist